MPDREESLEQEMLDLLRAVDVGADVEPSPGFVASVLARMDDDDEGRPLAERFLPAAGPVPGVLDAPDPSDPPTAEVAGAEDADPTAPLDLEAARLSRAARRRPWLAGAAAAAVVGALGFGAGSLVAGGGLAAGGNDAGTAADAAGATEFADATELAQEDSAYPGPVQLDPATGALAGAGGGAEASAYSSMPWGFFGAREFVASFGLGQDSGTAAVFGLDPQRASEATAAELAQTLGVAGEPRLEWGSWVVGPTDGAGPVLSLSLDGSASFSYSDWTIDPMQGCWEIAAPVTTDNGDDPAWAEYEESQQACQEEVAAAAPAPAEASAALAEFLGQLGFDPADYEITTDEYFGSGSASASAARIVSGQRTNLTFSLTLAPDGVVSVWGSLADVVELETVEIVSESAAFARLADPRFGAQYGGGPMPVWASMGSDAPEGPTQAPAAPTTGTSIEWPVWTIDLTQVRLGLAQHYQADGSVLLVPAYEFTDSGGLTWSVIAVADGGLDFSQPNQP